jgi:hypothetical protein
VALPVPEWEPEFRARCIQRASLRMTSGAARNAIAGAPSATHSMLSAWVPRRSKCGSKSDGG